MGLRKVEVFVKGPGSGREAAVRGMASSGLEVSSIKDRTPFHTMDVAHQKEEEFNCNKIV